MVRYKVYHRSLAPGALPWLMAECHPPDDTTPGCPSFVNLAVERNSQYMIEMQVPLQDGGTSFMQLPVGSDTLAPDPCAVP